MIAAVCAAGTAGLYAGITHLAAFTMGGSPSALSLIQMIGGEGFGNLMNGLITLAITLVASFVISYLLYRPEELQEDAVKPEGTETGGKQESDRPAKPLVERIEVKSPLKGTVVPLKEVADSVFSGGGLGEGIAIEPADGRVYAPADGVVSAVMDSRHAVGITADNGAEILIHVGLDTVKLEGEGFIIHCKMGDRIKTGDLLLECDVALLKKRGYDIVTPVLISNSAEFVSIKAVGKEEIAVGDVILTAV